MELPTGMSLEASWSQFSEAIQKDTEWTEDQLRNARIIFFSGAVALFELQAAASELIPQLRETVLHSVAHEMKEHVASIAPH